MIYLYGARIRTDIFNRYKKEKKKKIVKTFLKITGGSWVEKYLFEGHVVTHI